MIQSIWLMQNHSICVYSLLLSSYLIRFDVQFLQKRCPQKLWYGSRKMRWHSPQRYFLSMLPFTISLGYPDGIEEGIESITASAVVAMCLTCQGQSRLVANLVLAIRAVSKCLVLEIWKPNFVFNKTTKITGTCK